MRPVYTDLYALFRRDPGAEEYFNQLPAYVRSWWRRSAERPFFLRRSARERYMAG